MARTPPIIVWFRDDLRLSDHPAPHAAAAGVRLICIYVLDPHRPDKLIHQPWSGTPLELAAYAKVCKA
jgi:deoxyribodipyrimidine photolyase